MAIYSEQPDEFYGFKAMVACISDGRIVETCGYTLDEAKKIMSEIMKEKEEIKSLILSNRKE